MGLFYNCEKTFKLFQLKALSVLGCPMLEIGHYFMEKLKHFIGRDLLSNERDDLLKSCYTLDVDIFHLRPLELLDVMGAELIK